MLAMLVVALSLAAQTASPPAPPQPATKAEEPYKKIDISTPDVQAAAKEARAVAKLNLKLISAERHAISSNNLRLCLANMRRGDQEFAQVVLSRDDKKRWNVTVWSWGSCTR